MQRICPKCGSTSVVTFDADEDWCTQCQSKFPGMSTNAEKSCHGCESARAEKLKAEVDILKGLLLAEQEDCQLQRTNKEIYWRKVQESQSEIKRLGEEACTMCVSTKRGPARITSNVVNDVTAYFLQLEDGSGIGMSEADVWQWGRRQGLQVAVNAVDAEPEYPGEAPPVLCSVLQKAIEEKDMDLLLHAMRQTVRLTKECIIRRINESV